ncbi:MAG: YbdK family carboxylate-amine ligase, partial [Woeseiaceae bacterium]|nr:YbdK family carboxylate-amine ligase [Woeseiaceae bacterium]
LITPLPRYKRLAAGAGLLSYTQITFSTHVHVGLRSGDEAMHVMSQLIPAVPIFMALSANSPFWRGHDTGHAAYRHRILAAAPNYGIPTRFPDWATFDGFLNAAMRGGAIQGFKDIHWDIRPHPDFGTLELRAMDSVSSLHSVHAVTSLARALMLTLADAEAGETAELLPQDLPHWIERENRYRAAHLGLEADFIINRDGDRRPLREVAADLIELSRDTAAKHDETAGLELASNLLETGPDYRRQVEVYEKTNLMRAVVEDLEATLIDSAKA